MKREELWEHFTRRNPRWSEREARERQAKGPLGDIFGGFGRR